MSNADLAVIEYLQLAKISQSKGQVAGADRFLVLAGLAACRAGWLDVAEGCRRQVLRHNPHHILSHWESLPDALRSAEFANFQRQLERFCSVERAESLLAGFTIPLKLEGNESDKSKALAILADACWSQVKSPIPDESATEANEKTE